MITVTEAAAIANVTPRRVRALFHTGKVHGEYAKVDGVELRPRQLRIDEDSLRKWMSSPDRETFAPGRPAKEPRQAPAPRADGSGGGE